MYQFCLNLKKKEKETNVSPKEKKFAIKDRDYFIVLCFSEPKAHCLTEKTKMLGLRGGGKRIDIRNNIFYIHKHIHFLEGKEDVS